jgi:hypothetical protein
MKKTEKRADFKIVKELLQKSIKDLGYISTLNVSGIGLTATASTTLVSGSVQKIELINGGYRYSYAPIINISPPQSGLKARAIGIVTSKMGLLSSQSLINLY